MKKRAPTFRILSRIASGGMGEVHLALLSDRKVMRLVALKRIHPEKRSDPEVMGSFLREQKVTALLHHPNVVGQCGAGEDEEGPWLALEYVHGTGTRR